MPTLELHSESMQALDHGKMAAMREKLGIRQVEAAARAGMSLSQWNDIESGRRSDNLKLATIARIAAALDCQDVRDLITPPEKPSRRAREK